MTIEFRGIDPAGLTELATLLEQRRNEIDAGARRSAAILHSVPHAAADVFSFRVQSVIAWAGEAAASLRRRAATIRRGQHTAYGQGTSHRYVDEAHYRALIAGFVPLRFDLDEVYRAWMIARAEGAGRELGERYLAGEDVSLDLSEQKNEAHYGYAAAGFFNIIGDEPTANLPRNLDLAVVQGALSASEAAAALRRYAHGFAAATATGALEFGIDELFAREDPLAELGSKYAAAMLFTEPGIAADWLESAADRIVLGESYLPWIISPDAVAAVIGGFAANPAVAARALARPRAAERLLRRSLMTRDTTAADIGELLVLAATTSLDSRAAAQVAAAMIGAIGSGDVQPHEEVLPHAATVGGAYIAELAYSLADSAADPTYSPRFKVSRATARVFFRNVMRSPAGYATLLAATQAWVLSTIAPAHVTTLGDYTTWVQNKADDIGRLLGTLVSADIVTAVEQAEDRAKRQQMLLDVVKALGQVGAEFTGPASMGLQPLVDFLRSRSDELLGGRYVEDAYYDNQMLQESLLDELDRALHEVMGNINLTGDNGDLEPGELEYHAGAIRNLLRSLITAELLAFSLTDIRPDFA